MKHKETTEFKLALPNAGNECKVAPESVFTMIATCKQTRIGAYFAKAEMTVKITTLDAQIAKTEYVNCTTPKRRR